MLTPIFTHGTYDNTIKAISEGKIRYPAFCWVTDRGQYGFLDKDNNLEVIGIPEFTGTLDNVLILSTFDDGLYQIKGPHKITASHSTTFDSSSFIIVIVQTINGVKKVRRIDADEVTEYTIEEDLSVTVSEMATKDYLVEMGYATEDYVDEKMAAMEAVIMADVEAALPGMMEGIVRPVVEEVVDETIQPEDDDNIRDLFN